VKARETRKKGKKEGLNWCTIQVVYANGNCQYCLCEYNWFITSMNLHLGKSQVSRSQRMLASSQNPLLGVVSLQ